MPNFLDAEVIVTVGEPAGVAVTAVERGPKGDSGPTGPAGPAGSTFEYVQSSPSAFWNITHNLGHNPSVTVIDSADSEVEGDYYFPDLNHVQLTFTGAFSGIAHLV